MKEIIKKFSVLFWEAKILKSILSIVVLFVFAIMSKEIENHDLRIMTYIFNFWFFLVWSLSLHEKDKKKEEIKVNIFLKEDKKE
jgi:hypothetical protein